MVGGGLFDFRVTPNPNLCWMFIWMWSLTIIIAQPSSVPNFCSSRCFSKDLRVSLSEMITLKIQGVPTKLVRCCKQYLKHFWDILSQHVVNKIYSLDRESACCLLHGFAFLKLQKSSRNNLPNGRHCSLEFVFLFFISGFSIAISKYQLTLTVFCPVQK